jgi:5-(carboxyamino)imidazole ribonucleotide synthase
MTPFPTLGILGGGQLGKMMALAAARMNVNARFLAPRDAGPMSTFADCTVADWTAAHVLRPFAEGCDAVTVESEWAPAGPMSEVLPDETALWPAPGTVGVIKHKGRQMTRLRKAGLPLPSFRCCRALDEALAAARDLGYPVVLKQYEGSYDGYGNATATGDDELRSAWDDLAADDGLLVENLVSFECELSVLVARRPGGESIVYPVARTVQRDHRCHAVEVPARISGEALNEAKRVGREAVDAVEGVGITAAELFLADDGRILVNELAPRPHNTGHYTIDASRASQFENHVRAVLDWPLGDPSLKAPAAVMVNVLGRRQHTPPDASGLPEALDVPGASVHVYGKPEVRPNRKMGHVTVVGDDLGEARERAEQAAERIRL